ncbi:Phosphoenolpyruvate/phosphate translocator 2, chloroplastic [Porphyridium purpureum]|uniref:Phosphoenolpyruvate/phosphate translocator 2, chloroplastic n=1 Tax=Porphyridium purpureum TaxID=35688 RepID=A0A5J4YLM7_PORPP|nr:Phosphoenolpyruvate/phosphate translocator 2, chloroplastic [Porphyridium purpureum]|eukprot:POR6238..scf246_12
MAFVGGLAALPSVRGVTRGRCDARRSMAVVAAARSHRSTVTSGSRGTHVVRMAAAEPSDSAGANNVDAADASTVAPKLMKKVMLGVYILCWYAANILFNIYNKKLLKMFPLFTTVTLFQFLMGASVASFMWVSRLHAFQKPTMDEIKAIYPLAVAHLLGNMFTNLSLRQMAVSFTHTIKASEPLFSVVLGKIFVRGTSYHPAVYTSLLPIIAGVTLASVNEVSFNWVGFWTAMASNVSFQSRNVLSKKFMSSVALDDLNLFGWISILSFATLFPVAAIVDGLKWQSAFSSAAAAAGGGAPQLLGLLCMCGFLHFLYNQFSYVVLQRTSAVSHAVGNTMKRVAVIVSSVLVFHNPVTMQNKLGTAIAIAGVGLYSQVKNWKPKKKTE